MGKSWLALGVDLAIGCGGLALGSIPVKAGDVLYLALEDTPRRLQQRLNILLASLPDLPPGSLDRIHFVTEWPRMGMGGIEDLSLYVSAHPGLRLIVIPKLSDPRVHTRSTQGFGHHCT
jgi:RecA-family ATPase